MFAQEEDRLLDWEGDLSAAYEGCLVLDHGNIIESGTHDELMARSERYHDMVVLQTHPQN